MTKNQVFLLFFIKFTKHKCKYSQKTLMCKHAFSNPSNNVDDNTSKKVPKGAINVKYGIFLF